MAVDEYMALRGDKEMTEEEAEEFASKNTGLIQNAVKKSFTLRVVSIAATLVVAFLLDWFNPIATIVPVLAYQPLLTWGNYIYEVAKRIIARVEDEKAASLSEEPSDEAVDAEPTEETVEDSEAEEAEETSVTESEAEETPAESDGEEESTESLEEAEDESLDENEENQENTEGSELNV